MEKQDKYRLGIRGILEALNTSNGGGSFQGTLGFERKYDVNNKRIPVPERRLRFQSLIYTLSKKRKFLIETSEVFSGVDEYFIFGGNNEEVTLRLRFGSNRPCQLTMKAQTLDGQNIERDQFNIPFAYEDRTKMLATLTAISKIAPNCKHFLVGQSGEFWFVRDAGGHRVEIVLYQVGRADPGNVSPLGLFAEVAPRECPNLKVAVKIIDRYEKILRLQGREVKESIAELFGPK